MTHSDEPYWERKSLSEMTPREWEQICDGCGRCCLLKAEDEDTGDIHLTRLSCRLLDRQTCRCTNYPARQDHVPDCIALTPSEVESLTWLPPTCGYRRLHEGRGLAWWHPLVSGDPETVHAAGISVRGNCIPETTERVDAMEDFVVLPWPDDDEPASRPQAGAPVAGARVGDCSNTE